MRYYELFIDGVSLFKLDKDNPIAPRITFDLKQYDAGSTMPYGIITLNNLDRTFFQKSKSLIGKRIELYASLKESPITKLFNIKTIENNLIAYGYIANCYFNAYTGKKADNEFFITIAPSSEKSNNAFLLDIKIGDNLKDKITEALRYIYSNVRITKKGLTIPASYNEKLTIDSFQQARSFCEKYDIKIVRNSNGFLITDTQEVIDNEVILNPEDFLEMPTQIRQGIIQASLNMRGDLDLSTKITIPQSMFASINPSDEFNLIYNKSFISGSFKITKIWHLGDSRGNNAMSWSTNIEAIQEQDL